MTWPWRRAGKSVTARQPDLAAAFDAPSMAAYRRLVERIGATDATDLDGQEAWRALVRAAAALEATDLHVEPQPSQVQVRLRCDGDLWEAGVLPRAAYDRLLLALKSMAGMVAYVHSRPQDGRLHLDEPPLSVRAATLPVLHGEKITLRLLAPAAHIRAIDSLGMAPEVRERYLLRVSERQGMTLCVGPAGSGKTTTLYATLLHFHQAWEGRVNVATIEDPVEYEVPGFNQTPVNPDRGLTFASGLRSIVRHDPNAILVGEIRDGETAHIAFQAALSGHLVMSTMHGSDAVGGLYRLLEMGVEPEVVGGGLRCLVAQRLVRTVCAACAGVARDPACERCAGTGLRGRTGVFEVLDVDAEVQQALRQRVAPSDLERQVRARGVASLGDDLRRQVASGHVPPHATL